MSVRDLVQNTRHRENETEEFKLSKFSVISFDHKKQNEFSMSHENVARTAEPKHHLISVQSTSVDIETEVLRMLRCLVKQCAVGEAARSLPFILSHSLSFASLELQ